MSPHEIEKQSDCLLDSDTMTKENEEAMLLKDGVLVTYIIKTDRKEQKGEKEATTIDDDTCHKDSTTLVQTMSATATVAAKQKRNH